MKKQEDKLANSSNGPKLRLTLLATTDLHANIRPYNYYLDQAVDDVGLARVATLVDRIRADTPNCLLFDNGDTLQGTPLGDYAAKERIADGRPHPMIAAMNAMGYDAATLGNHDFDYGLEFLTGAVEGAEFPVVLANVSRSDGTAFLSPATILTRNCQDDDGNWHCLRIGVIGLTPPQITQWNAPLLDCALTTHGIVASARKAMENLREQGVDLVVALCHSGIGPKTNHDKLENAIVPLARIAGIDAIVAGHSHSLFPAGTAKDNQKPFGIPVVQPGFFGSHLGMIALDIERRGNEWGVVDSSAHNIPIVANGGDPVISNDRVLQVSAADHMATLGFIRRRIGASEKPLHSYFSLITNSALIGLIADAQRVCAQDVLADHPLRDLPLLSVAAPFKAGGRNGAKNFTDIPAGGLSIRNIADLYIYPNAMQILRVSGADIADWLERAACAYNQITPGQQGQLLLDHSFASYNFDVMIGLTYVIDPSQPARYSADGEDQFAGPGRIRNLCYQGQPVQAEDMFLVATNSYRASGGGHFGAAARSPVVLDPHMSVQDILIRHVAAQSPLTPKPTGTWRFATLPGTNVIVETGPGALALKPELQALGLTPAGYGPNGFARFEMDL